MSEWLAFLSFTFNIKVIYSQFVNMSTRKINKSETFSERLKALRGEHSKVDFAKELGINSPVTYFNYEQGRVPNSGILEQIASKCNVTVDWLLGRDAGTVVNRMVPTDQAKFIEEAKGKQDSMRRQIMEEIEKRLAMIEQHNGPLQEKLIEQIHARVKEYAAWCKANLENARLVAAEELAEHDKKLMVAENHAEYKEGDKK